MRMSLIYERTRPFHLSQERENAVCKTEMPQRQRGDHAAQTQKMRPLLITYVKAVAEPDRVECVFCVCVRVGFSDDATAAVVKQSRTEKRV